MWPGPAAPKVPASSLGEYRRSGGAFGSGGTPYGGNRQRLMRLSRFGFSHQN